MSLGVILKRQVAPFLAAQVPPDLAWRASGKPIVIPYYHVVSDEPVAHVEHLYRFRSVAEFEKDIDYFLRYYTPITLQQLIDHANAGAALPERAFHLTFDDGFREMHDVVMPILLAKGVSATFFLITDFVGNKGLAYHNQMSVLLGHCQSGVSASMAKEMDALLQCNGIPGSDFKSRLLAVDYAHRHLVSEAAALCGCDLQGFLSSQKPYMSADQARTLMNKGFSLGAHSMDHPLYQSISLEEQLRQTRGSMKFVTETFGAPCASFAFPHKDAGVAPDFFKEMFDNGGLKVSFGTGGMRRHFFPRNIERFSMEKTDLPAQQILGRQYLRKLLHS